jgi:hypothetical protein
MGKRRSGGGRATHSGTDYQNRVAAWIVARILAEQDASPPWGLPTHVTLDGLYGETDQPVDDIRVGTSDGGQVFIQAKHKVTRERKPDSDLATSLDQFVRQFHAHQAAAHTGRPWERPLDSGRDRLVLVIGSESSEAIRRQLPAILDRLRSLLLGQDVDDAAETVGEKTTWRVVEEHIARSWVAVAGTVPGNDDIRALLSLVRVQTLDVDPDENGELAAKDLLRTAVLTHAADADKAWGTLLTRCATYARKGLGGERQALQQALLDADVALRTVRSYRADIAEFQAWTRRTFAYLADFARIRVGPTEVVIPRECALAVREAAIAGSLVAVGEPGAGKSGVVHDLATALRDDGYDVVYLAVDQLVAGSLGTLRAEMGLVHDIAAVLRNWPGLRPGFFIVDGLDAARSEAPARTLRDLIAAILQDGGRWRVVASIRKYDLRYSQGLKTLFAGSPPTPYRDEEFARVRHVNVPALTDTEIGQVGTQSRQLGDLIDSARPELRHLLAIPFNLRLAGEILGEGVTVADLTPIRTQLELLDRYWRERVIRSDPRGHAREAVLRRVVEAMVDGRSLHTPNTVAADPSASEPLHDVLSSQILVEWQRSAGSLPDRYTLAFAHHMLFDYALERLMLRPDPHALTRLLEDRPDLVVFMRPSIDLHFQHLWARDEDRSSFWQAVLA